MTGLPIITHFSTLRNRLPRFLRKSRWPPQTNLHTLWRCRQLPKWVIDSAPAMRYLTFLGHLQRENIRPIWNRWLPLTTLRAMNPLLLAPDDLDEVRSEHQARRIPFLHYLAEAAGLIGLTAGKLKPTLNAETWLRKVPGERIADLWRAWQENSEENQARWIVYRLPACSAPAPVERFRRLGRALAGFSPGHTLPAGAWIEALSEIDPALLQPTPLFEDWAELSADAQAMWAQSLETALNEFLLGPLTCFGVLAPVKDAAGGERLAFTPLGAALTGRDDGAWRRARLSRGSHRRD